MKDSLTFEDALAGDQMLYQLAAYDTCKGMVVVPNNMDEAMDFQKLIIKKFNHFKRLIQTHEMSFDELNNMVAVKNGPFSKKKESITEEQSIDKIIEESLKAVPVEDPKFNSLDQMFGDILRMVKANNPNTKLISISGDLYNRDRTIDVNGDIEQIKNEDKQNNDQLKKKYEVRKINKKRKNNSKSKS